MRPLFPAHVRAPAQPACRALIAALLVAGPCTLAQAQGDEPFDRSTSLQLRAEAGSLRLDGRGWVARIDLRSVELDRLPSRAGRPTWQLLGDYYFGASAPPLPSTGAPAPVTSTGLRATGGLIGLLPRGPASLREPGTLTYLGLGYTLGLDRPGWGVKADVGLLGTRDGTGGLRLNRSGASMEDASVGDLRWLPLLQVGVSYAF